MSKSEDKEEMPGKKLRPEDTEVRGTPYMDELTPHERTQLFDYLGCIPAKHLTMSEKFFLFGKDAVPQVVVTSPGVKAIQDMIQSKTLGQAGIDRLVTEKVEAIYTPPEKNAIRIDMPPESGCTHLVGSPGGYMPVTAFGSEFIDRGALRAHGFEVVDYDPKNPGMNPPNTVSGMPTADRRVNDPEFAETIKANKMLKENPKLGKALHAAMVADPL